MGAIQGIYRRSVFCMSLIMAKRENDDSNDSVLDKRPRISENNEADISDDLGLLMRSLTSLNTLADPDHVPPGIF